MESQSDQDILPDEDAQIFGRTRLAPAHPRVTQAMEDVPLLKLSSIKIAPNNGNEAAAYLRGKHQSGSTSYVGRCLQLQREARGLPAVYPSALSAALATPQSERVTEIKDLRRGMVAYCDDPVDGNPYGHIFFIAGWKDGVIITISNDVKNAGAVDYVPLSFYRQHWGDKFQFGATWLNGYDFSDFNKPPEPKFKGSLADRYAEAIDELERIRKRNEVKKIDIALTRDIQRMKEKLKQFS